MAHHLIFRFFIAAPPEKHPALQSHTLPDQANCLESHFYKVAYLLNPTGQAIFVTVAPPPPQKSL